VIEKERRTKKKRGNADKSAGHREKKTAQQRREKKGGKREMSGEKRPRLHNEGIAGTLLQKGGGGKRAKRGREASWGKTV